MILNCLANKGILVVRVWYFDMCHRNALTPCPEKYLDIFAVFISEYGH